MHTFGLFTFVAAAQLARSVEINGYVGGACMGENIFHYVEPTFNNCRDISIYRQPRSVVVANYYAGQTVFFYSDNDCQTQIYSTSDEECWLETNDNANSYSVAQIISRAGEGDEAE